MISELTLLGVNSIVELEIGWILGIIAVLGGTISTLAVTIWLTLKERLAVQDKIIAGMRADIERMSKGCGQEQCHWFTR